MRKLTKEEFIRRARETHGDKYNYDKVVYVDRNTQVIVTCPVHGDFLAVPRTHIKGVQCRRCGPRIVRTPEEFIEDATIVHHGKFDYSKTFFKNFKTKVCIICPEHGEFWQLPQAHLIGKGCWKCAHEALIDSMRGTTEKFIERAREVHGDKYDYSKVEYKRNNVKVCIVCPEHGEFWQTPESHYAGSGCPKCLKSPLDDPSVVEERRRAFIEKATEKHNGKYDYSKVVYKRASENVCIICPEHGEFWQSIGNHVNGGGCPECAKIARGLASRLTTQEFIRRANEVHHGFYDYSETVYVDTKTKVRIRCPKHGFFEQYPYIHTDGSICPQCSNERAHNRNAFTTEMFIEKAIEKFGDKYDYSKVDYYNRSTPVTIICPIHGESQQTPTSHLTGYGCPLCAQEFMAKNKAATTEAFIQRATEVHGGRYSYKDVDYKNSITKVAIGCDKHGIFWQAPSSHLVGRGCPSCGATLSSGEEEIKGFLRELGIEYIERDRKVLNGKELDIYMPEHHLAIEYNGVHWHSELCGKGADYHIGKTTQCESLGIHLIHIFEDEWKEHKESILNKLRLLLQSHSQCVDNQSSWECCENSAMIAQPFFNKYHEDGWTNCDLYLSLFVNGEIVSMMGFSKHSPRSRKWELLRFAVRGTIGPIEAGKRMLSYFVKLYKPRSLTATVNRCWESDIVAPVYREIGFSFAHYTKPRYKYIHTVGSKIMIQKSFSKKDLCSQYGFPPTMTVKEMATDLGYHRLWDCGCIIYDLPMGSSTTSAFSTTSASLMGVN